MAPKEASARRRTGTVVVLVGATVVATVLWAWPFDWFRTPSRPLPEVWHSFALRLPTGAHDIAYKDFGAYQGDQASIRFTVTRQELTQFMSTLRTGTNDPVKLQRSGIRYFDAADAEEAGWHLGKVNKYSSAVGFAGEGGSYYGGQISMLVDERKGPSHLVVYLSALKPS